MKAFKCLENAFLLVGLYENVKKNVLVLFVKNLTMDRLYVQWLSQRIINTNVGAFLYPFNICFRYHRSSELFHHKQSAVPHLKKKQCPH